MAPREGAKTAPVSIRLSPEERTRLQADAGQRSLSDYIRARLFNGASRSRNVPTPTTNARQLAHILAALGQSELAPCLKGLLEAARIGALPVTPETEDALQSACRATIQMRADLIKAIGLVERGGS
jgi:hypothetical protein